MADHTVDQKVMDELIVACIGPAADSNWLAEGDESLWASSVAKRACALAEAIYAQRQACIEERAKADGDRRQKEAGRVRGSKVLQIKPEDMTGGVP